MTFKFASTLLAAACAAALTATAAHAQDKINIKIADYLPQNHLLYQGGLSHFLEKAKEYTNGRVTFEYFPGQQLGKAKDLLALAESGAVEMALIAPSYTSEKMPLTTISELPGLYTTSCQGTQALMEATRPDGALGDEFNRNGVRALISFMYQPADLLTAKKVVTTVDDWQGLKVRVAGGPTEVTAGEMGGVPVRMSATDLYQALSRGTVDAAFLVSTSAKSYSLDTIIEGITTNFSLGSIASNYVINEDVWNKLPADVQEALQKAGDEASLNLCNTLDTNQASELKRMEEAGITITRLNDEQRESWNEKASGLLKLWSDRIQASEERVREIHNALKPAS